MKDKLEKTREQKVKEHFDIGYLWYDEWIADTDYITYREFPDGDWEETVYDNNDTIVFSYWCYKYTDCLEFMNIITK